MTGGDSQPGRLSAADARKVVREIAAVDDRIVFLPHALKRLIERDVKVADVRFVIRTGAVVAPPYRDEFGNWRIEMQGMAGGDLLSVVVAIEWRSGLLVITVYADEQRRSRRR